MMVIVVGNIISKPISISKRRLFVSFRTITLGKGVILGENKMDWIL